MLNFNLDGSIIFQSSLLFVDEWNIVEDILLIFK